MLLLRFIGAVLSKVRAYITGSVLSAIAFVYEHLTKQMIPANIVLWGLGGFFVSGAFLAWLDEYRSGRALEIRNQLDALVRRGDSLQLKWLSGIKPRWRTKRWIKTTAAFARRNFTLSQLDAFNTHISEIADDKKTMDARIRFASDLQKEDPKGYPVATLLSKMLGALVAARKDIGS
jgi:hypothetical protein